MTMRMGDLSISFVRSGLRALLFVNLPAALFGAVVAALYNPDLSAEDLALLLCIPLLLMSLLMRIIMILRPVTPEERAKQADVHLWKVIRENPWVLVLLTSVFALLWACASLLAVPVYAVAGVNWAYGFAWAGMLFGLAVALFFVTI